MKEENGNSFCITCGNDLQSFAYNIEKYNNGSTALVKLNSQDEEASNGCYKRKFYLSNQDITKNDLILVNVEGKNVIVNRYSMKEKCLKVQKNIANLSYEVIVPQDDTAIEFEFSSDQKKSVSVFNVTSKEEVIPACSYNKYSKELKGKYRLKKDNQYIVINIK